MATDKERVPGESSANILGAICYIPLIGTVLALIILLTNMRRNRFMEYHAWQGGVFSVAGPLVVKIIWPLVQGLMLQGLGFIPFTWIFAAIGFVLNVLLIILVVWYLYLALLSEYFEVPVVISLVEPFMTSQSQDAEPAPAEAAGQPSETEEAPAEESTSDETPSE